MPRLSFGTTLVALAPFVMIISMVAIVAYFRHQRRRLWHETMRLALEKGQPLPANLVETPRREREGQSNVRPGLVLIGIGLAFFLALGGHARYFSTVPAFIGIALLLTAFIEKGSTKKSPDADKPSPRL